MRFTIIVTKKKGEDKEHLYSMEFEDKNITSENFKSKNIIPTLINRATEEILATSMPEEIQRITEKDDSDVEFNIVGNEINISFTLQKRLKSKC